MYNPCSGLSYTCFVKYFFSCKPYPLFSETTNHKNLSSRTGPRDLLVTHYDFEENEQKTLHKYAINQVTQCESEPQEIETRNIVATLYSKARATTVTEYKFTATFSEKTLHCSQMETKIDLITNLSIKVI